jgi:hypothetical protein
MRTGPEGSTLPFLSSPPLLLCPQALESPSPPLCSFSAGSSGRSWEGEGLGAPLLSVDPLFHGVSWFFGFMASRLWSSPSVLRNRRTSFRPWLFVVDAVFVVGHGMAGYEAPPFNNLLSTRTVLPAGCRCLFSINPCNFCSCSSAFVS